MSLYVEHRPRLCGKRPGGHLIRPMTTLHGRSCPSDLRSASPRMLPAVCCHQAIIIHVPICGKSARVVGVVRERPGGHLVGATNPSHKGVRSRCPTWNGLTASPRIHSAAHCRQTMTRHVSICEASVRLAGVAGSSRKVNWYGPRPHCTGEPSPGAASGMG